MFFAACRLRLDGRKRRLPLSEPQLPRHLLDGFQRDYPDSLIFMPFFSDVRHLMVAREVDPNSAKIAEDLHRQIVTPRLFGKHPLAGLVGDIIRKGSYLHLAAMHGDLPLAFESLRLGNVIHCTDKDGFSALYLGCRMISGYLVQGDAVQKYVRANFPENPVMPIDESVAKIRRVCLFLISQYSDPNETHDGVSLLQLACTTNSWDLIHDLLLHGADPSSPSAARQHRPARFFKKETEKTRFLSLVSKFQHAATPRPARLCPCGSALLLEQCHAVSGGKPYRTEEICPCGTRRIYSACCGKKAGMEWIEEWDEEEGQLKVGRHIHMSYTLPPSMSEQIGDMMGDREEIHMQGGDFRPTPEMIEGALKIQEMVVEALRHSGRIDPAYAAAAKESGMWLPSYVVYPALSSPFS
jgi:hypothetical protein